MKPSAPRIDSVETTTLSQKLSAKASKPVPNVEKPAVQKAEIEWKMAL